LQERVLAKQVAQNPTDANAMLNWAVALAKMKKPHLSIRVLERAVNIKVLPSSMYACANC
jgi:hypothetical protein